MAVYFKAIGSVVEVSALLNSSMKKVIKQISEGMKDTYFRQVQNEKIKHQILIDENLKEKETSQSTLSELK